MNKVVNDETSKLIILNQYIKDLSYENFQKNGTQNFDINENSTNFGARVSRAALAAVSGPARGHGRRRRAGATAGRWGRSKRFYLAWTGELFSGGCRGRHGVHRRLRFSRK